MLVAAIRAEADHNRPQRRATAIVDTARRTLVDAAEQLGTCGEQLVMVEEARREANIDFDRRAKRRLDDTELETSAAIKRLFREFDDWVERSYRLKDEEIQEAWDADERRVRDRSDELLRNTDARLRRRLQQLDEEVATAWSHRLEINLTRQNRISAAGLTPAWVEAAGRGTAAVLGGALGTFIGVAVGNAPGAWIGGTIGGAIGERIGSFLQIRRGQMARRRTTLQESISDALAAVEGDVTAGWDSCRESIRKDLAEHAAGRTRSAESAAAVADQMVALSDSAVAAVARADTCLLRALLRLEGRDRLARDVFSVNRRPGFACLVPLASEGALQELMLWSPNQLPEDVRPIPDKDGTTVFRRAAYALAAGRRRAVLVPDGRSIRAEVHDERSSEFLVAEAEFISEVIEVPIRLRSITDRSKETHR